MIVLMHGPDPVTFLYLPVTHPVQALPSGPEYPVLHLQSTTWSRPDGKDESEFAGQSQQLVLPAEEEYVPAKQGKQGQDEASNLYLPAMHPIQEL